MRGITIIAAVAVAVALTGCTAQTAPDTASAPRPGATDVTRIMSKAEENAANRFEAKMDATYPSGAPEMSLSGELQHGDAGDPMSTGTGVRGDKVAVTLSCSGSGTLLFRLRLPAQQVSTYSVACGSLRHLTLSQTTTGPIGFGVAAARADHPDVYYYAGFDSRAS